MYVSSPTNHYNLDTTAVTYGCSGAALFTSAGPTHPSFAKHRQIAIVHSLGSKLHGSMMFKVPLPLYPSYELNDIMSLLVIILEGINKMSVMRKDDLTH